MRVLNLGCGRRELNAPLPPDAELITLDADEKLRPDIVCLLGTDRIPLADNSIDCAIAIHVLEHIGHQGSTVEWFQFWEEMYRVLVPDGVVQFQSPPHTSVWAWADPSHARALSRESFVFLSQDSYRLPDSAISPFRIKCDFLPNGFFPLSADAFGGELRAVKPLCPWWEDVPHAIPQATSLTA